MCGGREGEREVGGEGRERERKGEREREIERRLRYFVISYCHPAGKSLRYFLGPPEIFSPRPGLTFSPGFDHN